MNTVKFGSTTIHFDADFHFETLVRLLIASDSEGELSAVTISSDDKSLMCELSPKVQSLELYDRNTVWLGLVAMLETQFPGWDVRVA